MLRCQAKVVDGQLRLTAIFTNTTAAPVWVAEALPVPSGSSMRFDEAAAYVRFEDSGAVVISKTMAAVPFDMAVESPEVPRWKRVEPSGSITLTLAASLPLTEAGPYRRGPPKVAEKPGTVACEVGYLPVQGDAPPRYTDEAAEHQGRARVEVAIPD